MKLQVLPRGKVVSDAVPSSPTLTTQEKRNFFEALLTDMVRLTEETIARWQRTFVFDKTDLVSSCPKLAQDKCQQLKARVASLGKSRFPAVPFASLSEVTTHVNVTITHLNIIIARLAALDYEMQLTPVSKLSTEVENKYRDYTRVLLAAAAAGTLPFLFTTVFKKKSGAIYLPPQEMPDYGILFKNYYNFRYYARPHLTELNTLAVSDAIVEVKHSLINNWLQLQKLRQEQKVPSEQDTYNWIAANDLVVAKLVLENPEFDKTRAYFVDKFATQSKGGYLALLNKSSVVSCLISTASQNLHKTTFISDR